MKKNLLYLQILYILNNGYHASLLLLLPFIAKDLGINIAQVGFLTGMLNVVGIIFSIPATYLAAKIGGLKVLLFSLLIYGLSYFSTSFANSFLVLAILSICFGVAFSTFQPVAFALLSRWAKREEKGKVLGNFTAYSDFGRVGFSVITTLIAGAIGWMMTAQLLAIIPLAVFAFLFFYHLPKEDIEQDSHTADTTAYSDILKNSKMMLATLAAAFDSLASSAIFVFLPFLFIARHISPSLIGSLAGGFFVGTFLGKKYIGKLSDKYGDIKLFVLTEALMAVFLITLSLVQNIYFTVIITVILGIMTKGTVPSSLSMVSKTLEVYEHHEKAFGVNSILVNIGNTIAPIILGFVSLHFGIDKAFIACAVFAILAIIPPFILQEIYKSEASLNIVNDL